MSQQAVILSKRDLLRLRRLSDALARFVAALPGEALPTAQRKQKVRKAWEEALQKTAATPQ